MKKGGKHEEVHDYSFTDWSDNTIRLSELFGKKQDLILIHNMGRECPMCTMWADGFNGVLPHLEDRAAFVVTSPDSPAMQKKFARGRGWKFKMLSAQGTSFIEDMGLGTAEDPSPGVSAFHKKGGKVYRVAQDRFGPGDDYCSVWHLFGLLLGGDKGWHPKFRYGGKK